MLDLFLTTEVQGDPQIFFKEWIRFNFIYWTRICMDPPASPFSHACSHGGRGKHGLIKSAWRRKKILIYDEVYL
jgi:hypothetical protein